VPERAESIETHKAPAPASFTSLNDEGLLAAIADGNPAAFDELFKRHSGAIYSFISRIVGNRCDPEDLLQESFLRVLTHAGDFRKGTAFRPWIYTIARNAALNAIKKTRLRSDLEVQTDLSDWQPSAEPDSARDPMQSAELQEEKARVLSALQLLPPLHREALVLIIFSSFSYEEAAAITGDHESTLRSRVFHALRKLRDRLKEQP
jgi:RNA polymerase sigma-70 factor, ECF subfamily